ncbi:sulfur carrier protein ThiS [Saccharomonospora saliphila]|uniref:sulfur carrier protein ThiS n=1 Tax=Saccharomonospora saliphila TaxID=369829 RepID=UPI00036B2B7E|nr:sulfur carrier protein ThiS [Saccharomonospora saliphila]
MNVHVNGESRQVPDESTVADVLATTWGDAKGVAVALDGEVVRRGRWPEVTVHDGARLEILTAVQGG